MKSDLFTVFSRSLSSVTTTRTVLRIPKPYTMSSTSLTAPPAPWYAAYPKPKTTPTSMSRAKLLESMQEGAVPGKDFLLVDLRRNDHEGGTIADSINLPAQSLYPTIPVVYVLIKNAGVRRVIWYCGSSKGRGTRAAAWFADYLQTQPDSTGIESVVLEEGVAGWVSGGKDFVERMLEYDASKWSGKP